MDIMETSLLAAILIVVGPRFGDAANLVTNCHQCETTKGIGLQVSASEKCLNLENKCSNAYFCLKTTTHMDKGGEHLEANEMGCWNYTTAPGITSALAASGVCYKQNGTEIYDGYTTYTEMCLCNDKDYCNSADRKSLVAFVYLILVAVFLCY